MMMPVIVPFRVVKYFVLLPCKWVTSMMDKFIMLSLKKLKMSREDARLYFS